MAKRPAKFTQADISRAIKGARDAGLPIKKVEVDTVAGTVTVHLVDGQVQEIDPYLAWRQANASG